ncbi:N-terminal glutamine amidase-domain-containing protein [Hygrophoropsis aurantiaca]|uniref:N-terminal glutamine amidase-domain-containing protein n=1 Tax=Hygrophoropsis aurantiaca TaxID=72124 RepID=A0ACB8ABQ6_9AGAM|nr:N-terminal glutamine amidase-domain-containing protein [Hygrophoropsis aurantiaca]
MDPSSFPPSVGDIPYTSCYCEENIYLLTKYFASQPTAGLCWDLFVIFISNPIREVALWCQRMASSREKPVIWDYHVVLALRERPQLLQQTSTSTSSAERSTWIYDFDTHLSVPCPWKEYILETFPPNAVIPPEYRSQFRIVPGEEYLLNFASDRSHMLSPLGSSPVSYYLAPPPIYPAICGSGAATNGVRNNLMTCFVSMDASEETYGAVMDLKDLMDWGFEGGLDTHIEERHITQ